MSGQAVDLKIIIVHQAWIHCPGHIQHKRAGRKRGEARLTEVGVVPLVEEELVADSLHDDVPGVDGAGAAHQRGKDGVGSEDVTLGLCQLGQEQRREELVKRQNKQQAPWDPTQPKRSTLQLLDSSCLGPEATQQRHRH